MTQSTWIGLQKSPNGAEEIKQLQKNTKSIISFYYVLKHAKEYNLPYIWTPKENMHVSINIEFTNSNLLIIRLSKILISLFFSPKHFSPCKQIPVAKS